MTPAAPQPTAPAALSEYLWEVAQPLGVAPEVLYAFELVLGAPVGKLTCQQVYSIPPGDLLNAMREMVCAGGPAPYPPSARRYSTPLERAGVCQAIKAMAS